MVAAGVRVGLALTMLLVLVAAQLGRHDDWFPLGMLGQYAQPRDPDGTVVNTFVEVRTSEGVWAPVRLTAAASGITRVELEQALPGLVEHPAGLADLALAHEQSHPGVDVAEVVVRQRSTTLVGGAVSGEDEVHDVVRWVAP